MSNDKLRPKNESPVSKENQQSEADSQRSIIKSTSMLSLGTMTSRIFGFLRDVVLAKLLGTGLRADAFFVALKIPNLLRDLVGDGAVNAAIVPVFSEYKEKESKEGFWNFVNILLALGLIVLSLLTIAGIMLTPIIVRAIAPGFIADPQKLELTIALTRLMFPYLVLISLTAYGIGVLYTFRSFMVPAFTSCLLNIAIIISAWVSFRTMQEPMYGLAIGVLVGGVLQLVAQQKALVKLGFRWRAPKSLRHPGAVKIGKLLIPRIMGSGVYQLTVLIDTFCASLSSIVGPGGISAIYYANRIVQLPMGVFSVALASAVLPSLSGMAQKKDIKALRETIVFSLENIFFIMCPTTVIILLLSFPIIRILFQRGEFDLYSTNITAWALSFYSIGLFSFGGIKILVTAFHALQDTKTPVKVAAFCLAINASLNFALMYPFKVGGIALASSIAGTVDFLILLYIIDKRLGGLNSGLLTYFFKVTLAAGITGLAEYLSWNHFHFSNEIVKLAVIGIGGFVLYEFICLGLRIQQARKIFNWIARIQ